jgi:hypothetical protein
MSAEGTDAPLDDLLLQLADLREQVTRLQEDQARITNLMSSPQPPEDEEEGKGYKPVPAPRWWQLSGEARAAEVARLRDWVKTVFRPGYGHLATQVGPCWEQHDLCLYQLAWLSELHTVIFYAPRRALGSEADWHTRLLPAAVALMAEETGRCDHLRPAEPAARQADPWASTS